jgi:mannose-1-phosphate guanylyltransferase
MLEHTLARVERLIPRQRVLVIVSRDHQAEAQAQLAHWPSENIIVQPANRDTGPGVLLPLAHISHRAPFSTVAIFPSDHFVVDEDHFLAAVRRAVRETTRFPRHLTLLGLTPERREDGYGWIEPGANEAGCESRTVLRFCEKPHAAEGAGLLARGALWNTFIGVGRAAALWELTHQTAPELYLDFMAIRRTLTQPYGKDIIDTIYNTMQPVNFSSGICQRVPSQLRVLPVSGMGWSDWGSRERILTSVRRLGKLDEVYARLRNGRSASTWLTAIDQRPNTWSISPSQ